MDIPRLRYLRLGIEDISGFRIEIFRIGLEDISV